MIRDEVADLLTVVSGYDRRTTGDDDIDAWCRVLDDPRVPNLGLTECVDALIMHHQESTEFVMPAHIIRRVKAARASNLARLMPAKRADSGAYADVKRLWQPALSDAAGRMRDRKAAVLAHPDLAARLTEEPLNYTRPDQWNGGIPPETFGGERNTSARREALVEIADEATRREAASTT